MVKGTVPCFQHASYVVLCKDRLRAKGLLLAGWGSTSQPKSSSAGKPGGKGYRGDGQAVHMDPDQAEARARVTPTQRQKTIPYGSLCAGLLLSVPACIAARFGMD